VTEAELVREIPINHLTVSRHQVRTRQVTKDLAELVENIRVHGQLEPIIVAPEGAPGRYEIIAGQRRWLAMKELNAGAIKAVILTGPIDEATARALSISENLVRQDVDPKDMIDACTKLYHKYGTVKAVAEDTGLPYRKVQSYVKYDRLRPTLKEHVQNGTLEIRTALRIEDFAVSAAADDEQVETIINDVKGLTLAQCSDYFRRISPETSRRGQQSKSESQTSGSVQPGAIHQILVTLPQEDHKLLRRWAASRKLTQDKAAAGIIAQFLRNLARAPASS
jgi:ParB family chromosome partitioning protein